MFTYYIIPAPLHKEKGRIRTYEDSLSIDLQSNALDLLATFSKKFSDSKI